MKLLRYLFQKRLVIVLILIFISINLLTRNYKHYGINKTVGWAFDIIDFSPLIFLISFYCFLIVYGIFALSKRKTNLTLSVIHALVISISAILLGNNRKEFLMITNSISIIIFLVNVFGNLKKLKN